MTAYPGPIVSTQVDAESYIDTILAGQWTDIILSTIENSSGSPDIIGLDPLDSITLSASAYGQFSGMDAYTAYSSFIVVFDKVVVATDAITGINAGVTVSGTLKSGATDYSQMVQTWGQVSPDAASNYSLVDNQGSAMLIVGGSTGLGTQIGSDNGEVVNGVVEISDVSSTSLDKQIMSRMFYSNAAGYISMTLAAGLYHGFSSAVDGIRFTPSSGNFESGKIWLYGRRQ